MQVDSKLRVKRGKLLNFMDTCHLRPVKYKVDTDNMISDLKLTLIGTYVHH